MTLSDVISTLCSTQNVSVCFFKGKHETPPDEEPFAQVIQIENGLIAFADDNSTTPCKVPFEEHSEEIPFCHKSFPIDFKHANEAIQTCLDYIMNKNCRSVSIFACKLVVANKEDEFGGVEINFDDEPQAEELVVLANTYLEVDEPEQKKEIVRKAKKIPQLIESHTNRLKLFCGLQNVENETILYVIIFITVIACVVLTIALIQKKKTCKKPSGLPRPIKREYR